MVYISKIKSFYSHTTLIRIPDAIAGWEPQPGKPVSAGIAHASRALEHAEEIRPMLAARAQNDNARRHVGIYALFDWCFGHDQQWLHDLDDDRAIFSHDHGLYLPPAGTGTWTVLDLEQAVDEPHALPDPADGLSGAAVDETARSLESVARASLVSILNSIPTSWSVSDMDLEALGWFLERRAPAVAGRLRSLV